MSRLRWHHSWLLGRHVSLLLIWTAAQTIILGLLELIVLFDIPRQVVAVGVEQPLIVLLLLLCVGVAVSVRVRVEAPGASVALRTLLAIRKVLVLVLVDTKHSAGTKSLFLSFAVEVG